jgi:hypothetical protein
MELEKKTNKRGGLDIIDKGEETRFTGDIR